MDLKWEKFVLRKFLLKGAQLREITSLALNLNSRGLIPAGGLQAFTESRVLICPPSSLEKKSSHSERQRDGLMIFENCSDYAYLVVQ